MLIQNAIKSSLPKEKDKGIVAKNVVGLSTGGGTIKDTEMEYKVKSTGFKTRDKNIIRIVSGQKKPNKK